jgi:hypothetical protein
MGDVLTTSATMTCPHKPGKVSVSASDALTVGGVSVFTGSDLSSAAVAGCPGVSASSIPPCKTVSALSGLSTALTAGGSPVVLSSTKLQTDNAVPVSVTAPPGALTAA